MKQLIHSHLKMEKNCIFSVISFWQRICNICHFHLIFCLILYYLYEMSVLYEVDHIFEPLKSILLMSFHFGTEVVKFNFFTIVFYLNFKCNFIVLSSRRGYLRLFKIWKTFSSRGATPLGHPSRALPLQPTKGLSAPGLQLCFLILKISWCHPCRIT